MRHENDKVRRGSRARGCVISASQVKPMPSPNGFEALSVPSVPSGVAGVTSRYLLYYQSMALYDTRYSGFPDEFPKLLSTQGAVCTVLRAYK